MGKRYGVVGGGRQGTAAAYDMAVWGDADAVIIADKDLDAAQRSAERVNMLVGRPVAQAEQVDVTDERALVSVLTGLDAFLSAVPYYFNLDIAKAAVKARASMCDLGGNTEIVRSELALDEQAERAGISIVPDCGQVPGMGTSLCVYAMSLLDKPEEVFLWDGGLDSNPRPPFNYILTFNIAGLTNEYYGSTTFIRDGKLVEVPTFQEYEEIDFPPPVGRLEAFTTAGGTSTAPWTFLGKLKTYQNKTVRYKGHFAQWRAFLDLGLLEEEPIEVQGVKVSPRQVLHTLLEPKILATPEDRDLVVIRVKCLGEKDGRRAEVQLDLMDFYDEKTHFTAMERTTGWHASIVAIMMAHGETPKGAKPVEIAVDGPRFAEEMRKRGFDLRESIRYT